MESDQNLSAIKVEPIDINEEIKSETKDELLVGITAQNISGGQEFEDTTGPISGSGVIKTEPTEIKSEPEDEPLLVEIAAQDVVDGQKFKEESDNEAQTQGRPKIETDNQSVFYGLDDNKRLVMKYTLGDSQSAESEPVVMSPLYKSIKMTIIEDKDEPEFINITPLSTGAPSAHERTHENLHSRTHPNPKEIKYFYCFHCNFKFKRKDHLQVHLRRHYEREEVEFECHICDFKTKKRLIYSYHIEKHTPVAQLKTLNCPECDFTTKFLVDLNEHKYKYHGLSYQCPKWPYQIHTQGTLNGVIVRKGKRQGVKKSKADILTEKRERERERRRKIRADPVRNQEQKEKERQRYLRQKQSNVKKSVKDMTPRELRQIRKRWKINSKNYRLK